MSGIDEDPPEPPRRAAAGPENLENTARLLEVERSNWWQAIDVLLKAMVIYLAILAALIGYVLTATLEPSVHRVLLTSAVFVSLTYGVANALALRNLILQMRYVHTLAGRLAAAAGLERDATRIHGARYRFARAGAIASFSVGALFVAILLYLLIRA
jgi:hypothetical protein